MEIRCSWESAEEESLQSCVVVDDAAGTGALRAAPVVCRRSDDPTCALTLACAGRLTSVALVSNARHVTP